MMKLLPFVIFCILLETAIFSYPVTLITITLVSIFAPETAVLLAFPAGIILDYFSLRTAGLSSLYFLILIYLGERYRKKIYGGAFIFRFLFLFISYIAYSLLFYKRMDFAQIIIAACLSVMLIILWQRFFPDAGSNKRLTV